MKSVTIYATSKCNLRCAHCAVGSDQYDPRAQQSTEELKRILGQLARTKVQAVTILGGEVTVYRDDLEEILDYAAEVGIRISINTNLTSITRVKRLLDKSALRSLIVSLDGASPESHDAIRGKGTFRQTVSNLRRVKEHSAVREGRVIIQIAFTMSGTNCHEAPDMLSLARSVGATHLNVKNVKITGRAKDSVDLLELDSSTFLKYYTLLIVNWLLVKGIELEIFIPPAYAYYLNMRFGLQLSTAEHHACGGTSVFSYVDLKGNHLPCPAMAFEENEQVESNRKRKEINLLTGEIESSLNSKLFESFEEKRKARSYIDQMHPCRSCRFNKQCVQCVAEIIKGRDGDSVDICKAVFEHGNEYVSGLREEIWSEC